MENYVIMEKNYGTMEKTLILWKNYGATDKTIKLWKKNFNNGTMEKTMVHVLLWNAVTVLCGQLDCDHGTL